MLQTNFVSFPDKGLASKALKILWVFKISRFMKEPIVFRSLFSFTNAKVLPKIDLSKTLGDDISSNETGRWL